MRESGEFIKGWDRADVADSPYNPISPPTYGLGLEESGVRTVQTYGSGLGEPAG